MSIEMRVVKPLKYKTRRLLPGENFRVKSESEARILTHIKRAERVDNANRKVALDDRRAEVGMAPLSKDSEDIAVVRQEYFEKLGRRPFNGWDIPTLREKIAEA